MTLTEAYAITRKMTITDHTNPTDEQRKAKEVIYQEVILPMFGGEDDNVPPYAQPDFCEGWK